MSQASQPHVSFPLARSRTLRIGLQKLVTPGLRHARPLLSAHPPTSLRVRQPRPHSLVLIGSGTGLPQVARGRPPAQSGLSRSKFFRDWLPIKYGRCPPPILRLLSGANVVCIDDAILPFPAFPSLSLNAARASLLVLILRVCTVYASLLLPLHSVLWPSHNALPTK